MPSQQITERTPLLLRVYDYSLKEWIVWRKYWHPFVDIQKYLLMSGKFMYYSIGFSQSNFDKDI